MIHVVTAANQHLYGRQLDQMFRMRHAYYIEGHGWSGLTSREGRETDEFDEGDVVYLLGLDPWGEVAASVRLNPTAGPTLLGKFASYADAPPPVGEDCWDISRWIAQPRHRRGVESRWQSNHQRELMIGILEFCQSRGLTRLTMLAEHRLAERIQSYGWPLRFLGEPREYEGGKGVAVAAEIEVGPHVLAFTRQKTGVLRTMLFEIDPAREPPTRQPQPAPADVRQIVDEIGPAPFARLVRAMAAQIADVQPTDRAQAVEVIDAFNRILESFGVAADALPPSLPQSQPGLRAPAIGSGDA
jgi:acyl-homoserine lactone synthase